MDFRHHLQARRPRLLDGVRRAAVALVLKGRAADAQMLFIERARHASDPWSGQIAFPGGGCEPQDADALRAALRETREEVGLELQDRHCIGRLDDQQSRGRRQDGGRAKPLVISCFVFQLERAPQLVNNHEVAASFWIDLAHLRAPRNRLSHRPPNADDRAAADWPAVRLDHSRVLWGLTYRFVSSFLETTGNPAPPRPG